MPTIFTRIIQGDLPGHIVYRDETCVAFMSIAPLSPGHTLVVPIVEVDHWIDLDGATMAHLTKVSQEIASVIDQAYSPSKVAMMIIGDEVPHVHIHLIPFNSASDLSFANAANTAPEELELAADLIRTGLDR
jgi:histidine triad (HIT) family protein